MPNMSLPGNPRYQPKELVPVFGYDNLYRTIGEVEISALQTLGELGLIPQEDIESLTPDIIARLLSITTTEVDDVERKVTKHDIRAWVRIAQGIVAQPLRRWIHVPLTSYDAIDTARTLQFVRAHAIVNELTRKVMRYLMQHVVRYAETPQIGRTHGQHALPITVGFWLATVLNRIHTGITEADRTSAMLVGKISGAVGAYNAQFGLGIQEEFGPSFEEKVLRKLGLQPAKISSQILPPEPLADYLFSCVKLSAAFGQFGRDCRHLMRTEIGEICEPFDKTQVGSSTMAHKRNPINFENLESTWLKTKVEFGKVLECLISEHQRDLVGSAISRDFPTIVVNVVNQLSTLLRGPAERPFIASIAVDEEALERNFNLQGDEILAEPLYIALQMAGYEGDAHELVNHSALPYARAHNVSLLEAARTVSKDDPVWDNIPLATMEVLRDPEKYTGLARNKALQIVSNADAYLRG